MTTNEVFWNWVQREMDARDLTYYRVEQMAGLSNAAISRPAREWSKPTLTVCEALASVFRIPLEDVLRRAGILPTMPADDPLDRQAVFLIHRLRELLPMLSPEAQRRVMSTAVTLADALAAAAGLTQEINERNSNRDNP